MDEVRIEEWNRLIKVLERIAGCLEVLIVESRLSRKSITKKKTTKRKTT